MRRSWVLRSKNPRDVPRMAPCFGTQGAPVAFHGVKQYHLPWSKVGLPSGKQTWQWNIHHLQIMWLKVKTIVNYPPVITIVIGGINHSQSWVVNMALYQREIVGASTHHKSSRPNIYDPWRKMRKLVKWDHHIQTFSKEPLSLIVFDLIPNFNPS